MSFVNEATRRPGALSRGQAERLVLALSPFAPHVAEELWSRLGNEESISRAPWPAVDPACLEQDQVEIVVQVMGKVRGKATVPSEADQDELERRAREAVPQWIEGKDVFKTIVVPGKLVNLLVR
jgi:leucyl-tRNA synthetase